MWRAVLVLVVAAGCNSKSGGDGASSSTPAKPSDAGAVKPADAAPAKTPAAEGCDLAALGLGAGHEVPAWTLPAGCTATGGDLAGTVTSEKDFAARWTCTGASGIDFAKDQLVIESRSLSPAEVGGQVVDDGKTVTFVHHFRQTCPEDPRPMPMGTTVMYLLPAGAQRAHADASCTVGPPRTCR